MKKFIIEADDDILDSEIFNFIKMVILQGKISNNDKDYCCLTITHDDIYIHCPKRRNTETIKFIITK